MIKFHLPAPAAQLALCSIFAAALSACGGGTTDPNATALATSAADPAASAEGTMARTLGVSAAATSDGASPAAGSASITYSPLAAENGSFTVTGTQTVRFGANSSWIEKTVTGAGQCTNAFFGNDPLYGTVKACQLETMAAAPVGTATPTTLAAENGSFTVTGTQTVRYGANASWIQKTVTGTATCSNAYFGNDPLYGIVKSCQLVAAATPTPAPVATVTAWVRVALENDAMSFPTAQTVRFGNGLTWLTKQVTGAASCSVGYYGSDPAYGSQKYCEVQLTVPAVTQVAGAMPVVNTALIPAAATSATGARVRQLSAAELSAANYRPDPSTVGSFREPCTFSHMSMDDPIAYPGRPGMHLHTFMGNDAANSASTPDSLSTTGGSTCSGGTLNRTAYWMPSMIDVRTGQPVVPTGGNFYYKLGYFGVTAGTVRSFPHGLRIIAGDSANTQPIYTFKTRFGCTAGGAWTPEIPSCAVGDTLMATVTFPQCWDGVNLDSPDHKSHMAYATGTGCPSDHPVALPEITLNVDYLITEANSANFWRLSSDNYSGPSGYSLHADWFGGWDAATNMAFVTNCINGNLDCHDQLLGDGRILY